MLDKAKNKGEFRPYLRNLNVRWFGFDLSDLTEMRFLDDEEARYTVAKGDLVICEGGYPGRAAIWHDEQLIHFQKALHRVRFVEPHHAKWCLYYLQALDLSGALKKHFNGAGIQHFTGEALAKFELPIAPLPEQQRIVAILDEAFDSIATAKANAEKNLQNAHSLFIHHREVTLAAKPGWLETQLANLCTIKHGYAFEGEFFSAAGNHVLLTPGSFFEDGGYRERGKKTKYFVGQIPNNYVLTEGDLLVAMTEQAAGLLGSPLLVPESKRFLHNQRLGLVVGRAGAPWSNEFFFHVFNLMRLRREIHASASGAKVRHTSPGKMGLLRVAYPDTVDEQRRIAHALVDLSEECVRFADIYERKLAALDELKKSLLQQAFSGAL